MGRAMGRAGPTTNVFPKVSNLAPVALKLVIQAINGAPVCRHHAFRVVQKDAQVALKPVTRVVYGTLASQHLRLLQQIPARPVTSNLAQEELKLAMLMGNGARACQHHVFRVVLRDVLVAPRLVMQTALGVRVSQPLACPEVQKLAQGARRPAILIINGGRVSQLRLRQHLQQQILSAITINNAFPAEAEALVF